MRRVQASLCRIELLASEVSITLRNGNDMLNVGVHMAELLLHFFVCARGVVKKKKVIGVLESLRRLIMQTTAVCFLYEVS